MQTRVGPRWPSTGAPPPGVVGRAAVPDARPAATLPGPTKSPLGRQGAGRAAAAPLRVRARLGSFDSLLNLIRTVLMILFGIVVGAFICAALGF